MNPTEDLIDESFPHANGLMRILKLCPEELHLKLHGNRIKGTGIIRIDSAPHDIDSIPVEWLMNSTGINFQRTSMICFGLIRFEHIRLIGRPSDSKYPFYPPKAGVYPPI